MGVFVVVIFLATFLFYANATKDESESDKDD